MALSLEQYAKYLDSRDLMWPKAPAIEPPTIQPRLRPIKGVRAVTFSVYGTLVAIAGGRLTYELDEGWQTTIALDKTIQEFKMWPAMTRKAMKPAEQLADTYGVVLERTQLERGAQSASGRPEIKVDALWQTVATRLMKNGYQYDASFHGPPAEYGAKIAYFFHRNLQGVGPYDGALKTLEALGKRGLVLGVVADGQSFTSLQLHRALSTQGKAPPLADWFDVQAYSYELRARKPAERLFRAALDAFAEKGVEPGQVLHVGNEIEADVYGAKQVGMRAALFVGDLDAEKAARRATAGKTVSHKPDVILTKLTQLGQVLV